MIKTRAGDVVGTTVTAVQKIIRRADIPAVTGYCIDHIYDLIKADKFPKPIPLGRRAVGWLESDIAAWQQKCIAARDGKIA